MISDLLEENADLRKQVEELKDEIATRNGKLAILISENERLKGIVLGNEEEISDLKKSCDETQELLDKQIEATYKLYKENAELKKQLEMSNKVYNDNLDYSHHIEEQLTKAKEIIRTFLGFAEAFGYSPSMDKFITEAEQFLSEVEK